MEVRMPSRSDLEKIRDKFRGPAETLGLLGFVLEGLRFVAWALDWKSRLEEAVSTASQIQPILGPLFRFALSPWFGVFLILSALLYAVFVPTEQQARPRLATFLAWVACIFSGLVLWSVVWTTAMGATGARHLTRGQQSLLKRSLGTAPDISSILLIVSYPECFECRAYAWEFAKTLNELPSDRWRHKIGVLPFPQNPQLQLSTDWRGVIVGADPNHLTAEQEKLIAALRSARIHYSFEPLLFNGEGNKRLPLLFIAPQEG